MGVGEKSKYSDVDRITEELLYSREIYRHLHCNILDVTDKSIEESAAHIIRIVEKNREIDGT